MNRPKEERHESPFKANVHQLALLQKLMFPRRGEKPKEVESAEKESDEVDAIELSALNAIVICSEANSHKFKRMFSHIMKAAGESSKRDTTAGIIPLSDEVVEEEEYNNLPVINHSPRIIAAVKAFSGRRYKQEDIQKRIQEIAKDVKAMHEKHDPSSKEFSFNKIGCVFGFRAQDIVTAVVIGETEKRQLKPKTEDKHEIYEALAQIFETDDQDRPEEMTLHWTGAEAMHDAVSDIGVVRETTIKLKIKSPDRAFLYCQILGTENVPDEFKPMADKFNQIYEEIMRDNDGSLGERLRGWNPKDGILNPHKVNAGFHSDTIFVERLLTISLDDETDVVTKDDPKFDQKMDEAIQLVRGEPVSFNRVYRTLLHILSSQASDTDPGVSSSMLLKGIGDKLQEEIGKDFPQVHRVFGGTWYDISDDQGQVPVDQKGQSEFITRLAMMFTEDERIH